MNNINRIQGEIHSDDRGIILSFNNFTFEKIVRSYTLIHRETNTKRGWNAHKFESKWFHCIKGSFFLVFIAIDNWEDPSDNLVPQVFYVSEKINELIHLPPGYASCIKAENEDSVLTVYSDKTFHESLNDSWKYSFSWFNWNNLEKYK
ncbi:MAG: WxcM-like domain-containing protein [Bacteroidales bacterium]